MSSPTQEAVQEARTDNAANSTAYAPGLMVKVRDELWLITSVTQSVDGYLLKVRGLSDYVRDTTASFYTALDNVQVFDPAKVEVVPDRSPRLPHHAPVARDHPASDAGPAIPRATFRSRADADRSAGLSAHRSTQGA